MVFYDQNRNGVLDGFEPTRLGGVTVAAAGRTTVTEPRTGRAALLAVAAGSQTFRMQPGTLPPFFVPVEVTATVPFSSPLPLPVRLPIGRNFPGVYMTVGDSITLGDGAAPGLAYPFVLERRLREEFGQAVVVNEPIDGGRTFQGAVALPRQLEQHRPAYVTIMYGTNDWNECKDSPACLGTHEGLRDMVREVRLNDSLPLLATILPSNTGFDDRAPPQRNEWVEEINAFVRSIAVEEGAVLVDLHEAFWRESGGNLPLLFADHIHPNNRGHALIAEEFTRAITTAAGTGTLALVDAWPAGLDDGPPPLFDPLQRPRPSLLDRPGRPAR